MRPSSDTSGLPPTAELALGNVTALDSLASAAEGVECIIHMAALVQAWARDPNEFDKVLLTRHASYSLFYKVFVVDRICSMKHVYVGRLSNFTSRESSCVTALKEAGSRLHAFSFCCCSSHTSCVCASLLVLSGQINVGGIQNVLHVLRSTPSVRRVLYTSTFFALGPTDGATADGTKVPRQGRQSCCAPVVLPWLLHGFAGSWLERRGPPFAAAPSRRLWHWLDHEGARFLQSGGRRGKG